MDKETVVTISSRDDFPGVTTGQGLVFELNGVEIPHVIDAVIEPINADGIVIANIRVCVRLGK
jgi:hypothetical protein